MNKKKSSALFIVACAFSIHSALASPPAESSMQEAEQRFLEGLKLLQGKNYEAAQLKFLQAYAVTPSADILWNLAVTEYKAERYPEAMAHFRHYVRHEQAKPERKREAQVEYLARAARLVGQLQVDAPLGSTVVLDGRETLGTAPLADPVAVSPGKHTLRTRGDGVNTSIEVVVGEGEVLRANLLPKVLAVPPVAVVPPPHTKDFTNAPPSRDVREDGGNAPFWTTRRIVSGSLAGLSLIALGVGVRYALSANDAEDQAESLRKGAPGTLNCGSEQTGICADLREQREHHDSDGTVALGSFAAAGVLMGGAALSWFLWPSREESGKRAWVAPSVTATFAGVHAGSRF